MQRGMSMLSSQLSKRFAELTRPTVVDVVYDQATV